MLECKNVSKEKVGISCFSKFTKRSHSYTLTLSHSSRGFSLVELSVVIVIIGLIVAGVTAGRALVNQAQFRGVISDINKFSTAATAFKTQYGAYPGDMANATAYWGAYAAGPPITGAHNGNGDGVITESWDFWRDLSLSGYLPGTYSGVVSTDVFQPSATIKGASYRALAATTTTALFSRTGNLFTLDGNIGGIGYSGVILAANAAGAIDSKMDDGVANTGVVYGVTPYNTTGSATECVSLGQWDPSYTANDGGVYNLGVHDKFCRMAFWF